jgi:hypothetical protein
MSTAGELHLRRRAEDTVLVELAGNWKLGQTLPSAVDVARKVEGVPGIRNMAFDTRKLDDWDTGLLTFLIKIGKYCSLKEIRLDSGGLPQGAKKLLELASAVPEKKDARKAEGRVSFLTHVGNETVAFFLSFGEMLAFIGDAVVAFWRLLRGKARYRRSDLWLIMEACSGQALPIVALICFLVGLILAFIGAIQLELFGAQIYVADLVGIAMVRLMAAIMTGRHGRAHRGCLRRPTGDHAGEPGDRCPENHGHIADGVPGTAADAGPGADDAPALSFRQCYGHHGGPGGRRRHARPEFDPVLQRDRESDRAMGFGNRPFLRRRVRCDCGTGRLYAGHAVRTQRIGGGECGHLRSGHRHCWDHCLDRSDHGFVQCAGNLSKGKLTIDY